MLFLVHLKRLSEFCKIVPKSAVGTLRKFCHMVKLMACLVWVGNVL